MEILISIPIFSKYCHTNSNTFVTLGLYECFKLYTLLYLLMENYITRVLLTVNSINLNAFYWKTFDVSIDVKAQMISIFVRGLLCDALL